MPYRPLVERNLRTVNGCDCWVVYVLDIQGVWGPLRFFSSWMVGEIQVSLKDPSQPHLCYCLQYRIWDRITRHTRGKGQRYNMS